MDITASVSAALNKEFNKAVYTEPLPQGARKPCFFVRETNHICKRSVGRRFYHKSEMLINYYPADKLNARNECENIAQKLSELLEFTETDEGTIYAVNRHSVIENGVLSFYADYEYFTTSKNTVPKMEKLEYLNPFSA